MRVLMWFRNDLRVRDNPALVQACRAADQGVLAVFAPCPRQCRRHDWGPAKFDFVHRNVRALSAELKDMNIPLLLLNAAEFGDVPDALLALMNQERCEALYYNVEYEVNERHRDRRTTELLERHGLEVRACPDQTYFEPGEVLTGDGGYYTVFTPFKNRWIEQFKDCEVRAVQRKPRRATELPRAAEVIPERPREYPACDTSAHWPAGESAARKRLRKFLDERVGDYATARDFPDRDGTSSLSPYLACGVISVRQCLDAALQANNGRIDSGRKGVATWISELIWREFYRHILVGYPRVCKHRAFKKETEQLPWNEDENLFQAWCEGRTGVPIVDAGMHQLRELGWMHNRVRMIVAMYLTKNLFIDWRWGERFFMEHLVDADLANNNGGWQWAASTGTDAAPYFRIFNPASQAKRYDPRAEYIRAYVPELADLSAAAIHDARRREYPEDYPDPLVDHASSRKAALSAFQSLTS